MMSLHYPFCTGGRIELYSVAGLSVFGTRAGAPGGETAPICETRVCALPGLKIETWGTRLDTFICCHLMHCKAATRGIGPEQSGAPPSRLTNLNGARFTKW